MNRTKKAWLSYGIHLLMKKVHPTNNICKQRRSPKKRDDLNIWILICEITRGMQHSVKPCIHQRNEYQQNRFNTFGNKFCKNFCHYIFLVQFVFSPHFKERHIPCYNVTTTTEKPTWNDLWMRCMCWIKELQNPFVSDRWHKFWHESQLPHRAGLTLGQIPTVPSLTWVNARGCPPGGGGWVVLELTGTLLLLLFLRISRVRRKYKQQT